MEVYVSVSEIGCACLRLKEGLRKRKVHHLLRAPHRQETCLHLIFEGECFHLDVPVLPIREKRTHPKFARQCGAILSMSIGHRKRIFVFESLAGFGKKTCNVNKYLDIRSRVQHV